MADLIAEGKSIPQRWWQKLPEGETVLLGRAPRNGLSVPWDLLISREHARLRVENGVLTVTELATARNPILLAGRPHKEFTVDPDGEFTIGETTFRFEVRDPAPADSPTVIEHTFGTGASVVRFDNASACLEALCQMPGLISQANTDADFAAQVVDLPLNSLRGALVAAVVQFELTDCPETADDTKLIRWNSRDDEVRRFRPSRRLMRRALEQQQSVVHLWSQEPEHDDDSHYTMTSEMDWAFCTPIPTAASERWCLYVSGRRQTCGLRAIQSPGDLLGDLRLAELMARFIGAVRQVRVLEHQQTAMRQFFSPAVIETLSGDAGSSALEPREGPVSVLFCDIRGFTRKVEESSHDLHSLLDRVSEALSVMTRSILKYEGVIADFQGDAALGFWGWPNPTEDAALLACRAALSIQVAFAEANSDPLHPLNGFRVGIGICHGEAIAGRIGSQEQVKVGVFGPVVNLAARLQDLTKQIGVPILIDGPTAAAIGPLLYPAEADCRRVTRLRPSGIATPVEAFALTPGRRAPGLTIKQRRAYDLAVEAVIAGDWQQASELLDELPMHDNPANFLRAAIEQDGGTAPANWDGALNVPRQPRASAATRWPMTDGGRISR